MIARCLPFFLVAFSLPGCATHAYSARPITAKVVDAETEEPLEGVNVVAHWVLHDRMTWGGFGDLELFETITDREGGFIFRDGWTRSLRAPGRIKPDSATMIPSCSEDHTGERYSDWDGKTIKLERVKGDLGLYTVLARGITTGLGSGIKCPWKKTPRFYASQIKERGRLDRLGVRTYLPTLQLMESNFKNSDCSSAREFFEEYLK
jgi:hypothetical protein